jgi:hypothetical protein
MKKTLVPLTQAQMDLIVACLVYCESHPSHRDIEIVDVREKMQFFALKDKCSEPVKTFAPKKSETISGTGELAQGTSSTDVTRNPIPSASLIEKLNQVGIRTEKKRKYNKSKLNPPNNYNA